MSSYKQLLQEQKELAVRVEEARKQEIADAVTKVRNIVEEFALTQKDVFPSGRKSAGPRTASKVAPKYRNPATGQTWTGRGKAPKWIEGQNREQFAIA
ncbi:MAG: H-NS histone family protein [Pseudomonadota bacterium]|nr:H-NS histone family protein [Pseudomonadota bacterium]